MMTAENVVLAFHKGLTKKLKQDFTTESKYFYRNNKIAYKDLNTGDVFINSCGWMTMTTKDRLCKLGYYVVQKKGIWYVKDKQWDGSLINYTKW